MIHTTSAQRIRQSRDIRSGHVKLTFVDSEAQYERHFKKWKFHKYRKPHDWKSAGRIIEKRKRDGKESDVYIDGVLISKKKIRKEISRHNFPTIQEHYGQGSIHHNLVHVLDKYLNSCSTKTKNTGWILYLHAPALLGRQLSDKQSSLL